MVTKIIKGNMGRKKLYITTIAMFACAGLINAQDYFDDVYYNPKKDKSATVSAISQKQQKQQRQSNYIADLGNMDVDAYNRRGSQYYVSQIDTIGTGIENGEDFIYTQQIQKFYNPTVVVDNANALSDVLSNAYGNVEIIINDNGLPVFAPYYAYGWPYYSYAWSPWNWGINIGPWGWNIGWYDPWYSWNWGWGPGWWNPGPVWGPAWGPGWGPGWRPGPGYFASWNPRGNRPVGPRPGWGMETQHRGGNYIAGRGPSGGNYRPATGPSHGGNVGTRSGGSNPSVGVVNNNGRWQYNTSKFTGHRNAGTGVLPGKENGKTLDRGQTTSPSNSRGNVTNQRNNNNNNNRNNVSPSRTPSRSYGNSGGRTTGGGRSTGGGSRGGGGGRHR